MRITDWRAIRRYAGAEVLVQDAEDDRLREHHDTETAMTEAQSPLVSRAQKLSMALAVLSFKGEARAW
jgi:hypothetical protein